MRFPSRLCLALMGPLLALALNGCSGLLPNPPAAPPATFLLAPELTSSGVGVQARGSGPILLIARPEPSAGYGTARMAYMEEDYRLDYFADHEWVDPPAAMLEPLLVRALGANPAFGAVSSNGRGIRADLRLDTAIEALYQDFRTRPSRGRVGLRVRLVDLRDGQIIATKRFEDTEPAAVEGAYGGVQALNRILARLLPEIAEFAARAAPPQAPPP
ncbi:MAG: ABC-type transport auxiliary lipoprotein family protein [Bdellovibrio bacteriovorus]